MGLLLIIAAINPRRDGTRVRSHLERSSCAESEIAGEFWRDRRAGEKARALLVSDDLVGRPLLDLLPLCSLTPCWYNPHTHVALATVTTHLIICTAPHRYLPTTTIDGLH